MSPEEARQKIEDALTQEELPYTKKRWQKLLQISVSDMHPFQMCVISSIGPPHNGWTRKKWRELERIIPGMMERQEVTLYRGTRLPWINGRLEFDTLKELNEQIRNFVEEFDNKKSVKLSRPLSFTKSKRIAKRFAGAGKGEKLIRGYTYDEGYIHVIKPYSVGIDVEKQLSRIKIIKSPDSDELLVAKREKEVLLMPGAILQPMKRKERVFFWTICNL
jgi:hypothetical protein